MILCQINLMRVDLVRVDLVALGLMRIDLTKGGPVHVWWQSCVEMEYYSFTYFNCIVAFKATYH